MLEKMFTTVCTGVIAAASVAVVAMNVLMAMEFGLFKALPLPF